MNKEFEEYRYKKALRECLSRRTRKFHYRDVPRILRWKKQGIKDRVIAERLGVSRDTLRINLYPLSKWDFLKLED